MGVEERHLHTHQGVIMHPLGGLLRSRIWVCKCAHCKAGGIPHSKQCLPFARSLMGLRCRANSLVLSDVSYLGRTISPEVLGGAVHFRVGWVCPRCVFMTYIDISAGQKGVIIPDEFPSTLSGFWIHHQKRYANTKWQKPKRSSFCFKKKMLPFL